MMYCSRRNCFNEIFIDTDGLDLCQEHYIDMKKKLNETKLHTPNNCYCGKDHTRVTYVFDNKEKKEIEK